jgi:murein endopeptidase
MAKGQHLSRYQQKIVHRYYEHLDTIAITKVAEATSELYLCTDPKKAEKIWQSVAKALDKTAASDAQVRRILEARDVKGLAELVGKLSK